MRPQMHRPPRMSGPGGLPPPPGHFQQQMRQRAPRPNWMARPTAIPQCPPGLEYLTLLDQLHVRQQMELFEVMTGFDMPNRYAVLNANGQQIYFAGEDSDVVNRACMKQNREFELHIIDNLGKEVIRCYRPASCVACCCFCCLTEMTVEAPPGRVIGNIQQVWAGYIPKLRVEDEQGNLVFMIVGPACQQSICGNDVEFDVCTPDQAHSVGLISKHFSGMVQEYYTKADNFGISFPKDLHIKMKAVLLAACFLIDFMFFEGETPHEQRMRDRHHHGRHHY